ncbi:MAG: Type I phosphodiesterase / nucleotide pyrophosphatase [candidate division BRC1 bacterium ADurb.BinA364]|nr:MAG: Type I phosphodiesterase / nucleotide pyrophosphatase [candidate division BRC1 bacterium ADurb.BinA364]
MTERRFILLGMDGATFANLKPWADEGTLPNLQRLMRQGAWGTLASTNPPTTPPAWTAVLTGKNPGKHGIFDFRESPYRDRRRPLVTSASARGRKLWHILNGHGVACGALNVPITWPPEKIDSFMISGMMTPGPDSAWAEPPELKREIDGLTGGYFPDLDIARFDTGEDADALEFLRAVEEHFDRRAKATAHLMASRPWRFFMPVFILPDRIQHLFWKYIDPSFELYHCAQARRLRDRIIAPYRKMDAMLGRVLDSLGGDTDLMIVSDHGFGGTEMWFNVNVWLERQGWLARARPGRLRHALFYRAMIMNESPLVRALIPGALQSAIRRRIRARRNSIQSNVDGQIDWRRTQAFFSGIPSQGIYLNLKGADGLGAVAPGAEAEALRRRIKEALLALRHPDTGETVVEQAWFREELYEGPETPMAPDIFFKARNYAVLGRSLFGDTQPLRGSLATPNGFHRPDGVLLATGRGFRGGGARIEGARLIDIAPTVLHAMGFPVPDDMDGRPIEALFEESAWRANPPRLCPAPAGEDALRRDYSAAEDEAIRDRLKGLGYLE